jgi:hypothetical protein
MGENDRQTIINLTGFILIKKLIFEMFCSYYIMNKKTVYNNKKKQYTITLPVKGNILEGNIMIYILYLGSKT